MPLTFCKLAQLCRVSPNLALARKTHPGHFQGLLRAFAARLARPQQLRFGLRAPGS